MQIRLTRAGRRSLEERVPHMAPMVLRQKERKAGQRECSCTNLPAPVPSNFPSRIEAEPIRRCGTIIGALTRKKEQPARFCFAGFGDRRHKIVGRFVQWSRKSYDGVRSDPSNCR